MTIEDKAVRTKGFVVKPVRRRRARMGAHIFANAASDRCHGDIETPTWPGSGSPGDRAVLGIGVGGVEVDTPIGVIHERNQRFYLDVTEMQKRDAESILSGTRWLSAVEVAQEKNEALRNRNALANRWKNEGRVFAIKHEGVERYPHYAFDARMEPLPVISEVISRFGPQPDAWNIASWFESSNAWLKSRRPREILDDPEKLLWALDQRKGWMHG